MLASESRFSATAEDYERHRPGYPAELRDWLVEQAGLAPGDRIADIGCGTGISTRFLAAGGFRLVGVDPSAAMLARAQARGQACYLRGLAAATGLRGASFALACAAQAFHWFDLTAAAAEMARLVGREGWIAAFWNRRAGTPLLEEYEGLLRRRSRDYALVRGFAETLAALRELPGIRDRREASFPARQDLDREGLLGRAHSASYVRHGVDDLAAFDAELEAIFARHAVGGRVAFDYLTIALLWRP